MDEVDQDAVIYFHDRGVVHPHEIIAVDSAFAKLVESTRNTKLLKLSWTPFLGDRVLDFYRQGWHSNRDIGGDNDIYGNINMFEGAFANEVKLRAIVIHEIGHNWEDEWAFPRGFKNLSGWREWSVSAAVPAGYTRGLPDPVNGHPSSWIYLTSEDTAGFARNYGKTDPSEDFATCLENYYVTGGYLPADRCSFIAQFLISSSG